jgi:hypothetical protein
MVPFALHDFGQVEVDVEPDFRGVCVQLFGPLPRIPFAAWLLGQLHQVGQHVFAAVVGVHQKLAQV